MKIILATVCFVIAVVTAKQLPSFIEVCHPKREDVSKCLKRNVENLRPKFAEGIPELNLPAFRPLKFPGTDFKLGQLKAEIKDIKVWVPKGFSIEKFNIDLDNFRIDIGVTYPEILTESDYKVNGKFLAFNLKGGGVGKINLYNLKTKTVGIGGKEKRGGKEYFVINSIDIKTELEKMDIDLENLFTNNAELTKQTNVLLNQNQKVIFEEFSPLIINLIKDIILKYMKNFFSTYSVDELFPND